MGLTLAGSQMIWVSCSSDARHSNCQLKREEPFWPGRMSYNRDDSISEVEKIDGKPSSSSKVVRSKTNAAS